MNALDTMDDLEDEDYSMDTKPKEKDLDSSKIVKQVLEIEMIHTMNLKYKIKNVITSDWQIEIKNHHTLKVLSLKSAFESTRN